MRPGWRGPVWRVPPDWAFSGQVRLYLLSTFALGLAMAQMMLFLNFFIEGLGLGASWQGFINALPALSLVVMGLPAASLARRISNARTLQLGALTAAAGFAVLATAGGAPQAVIGALLQGTGSAMAMVAGAPFLANNTSPRTRVAVFSVQSALMTGAGFLGNLVGGRIPELYAYLAGVGARDLPSIRAALLAAGLFQLLGLIPLAFLKPSGKPRAPGRTLAVRDRGTMARLVVPNLLVGLGAGATIPFMNIFIEGKFGMSYAQLGTLFAWASLATAVTALLQPLLVKRLGRLPTILLVQGLSLPFLAVLGFAPYLWMVTIAMFTRGALMNAAGPVYTSLAMDSLSESDRPMYSAVNTIAWNIGWASSSLLSGVVRSLLPFGVAFSTLFGITLSMYALSLLSIYVLLYLPRARRGHAQPLAADD